MGRNFHQRVQDLYLRALEEPSDRRLDYVREQAAGEAELREEVERLLRVDDADARLDDAISPVTLGRLLEAPSRIGDYEITGTLGEGGMGVVYAARQKNPQRSVALKVLRWGGTAELLRRFRNETEVLGFLRHPAIAHIYEAGVTDGALGERPYFSMELVEGERIDRFATDRGLSEAERVELMIRVLDGVSHAHQKGVVHRDLKPANLLVQGDGSPKILDFGVARVAALEGDETLVTRTGEVVGTLAYMSPEQIAADPGQIDTRADVYSSGVILYRLLSGKDPIDLEGATTIEAFRRIAQTPPKPLNQAAPDVSSDLVTIVHKALEKEKERRYASADAFAADLRRFLAHEPILARAPSRLYVAKRFVQRNKALTSALALAAIALVGGTVVSLSLYGAERRTNRDLVTAQGELAQSNEQLEASVEDLNESNAALTAANELADSRLAIAERRLAELNQSATLVQNILGDPMPYENGRDLTFATVVERASKNVLAGYRDRPLQRAWLALSMAGNANLLGMTERAWELLRAGRESYADSGEDQPLVRMQLDYLECRLYGNDDRHEEVLRSVANMLGEDYGLSPEEHAQLGVRAAILEGNALTQLRRPDEAIEIFRRAKETASALPDDPAGLDMEVDLLLADTLLTLGRFTDAKAAAESCLASMDERNEVGSVRRAAALNALGSAQLNLGELPEAVQSFESSISVTKGFLGPEHPLTAIRTMNLASVMRRMGNKPKARELYDEAVTALLTHDSSVANEKAAALSNRASLLIDMGELEAGEADLDACLAIGEGVDSINVAVSRAFTKTYRAAAYMARGDLDGAEALLREAIADKVLIFGSDTHPTTDLDFNELARLAYLRGDHRLCCEREIENARRAAAVYGPRHPAVEFCFDKAGRALKRYVAAAEHDVQAAAELKAIIDARRL